MTYPTDLNAAPQASAGGGDTFMTPGDLPQVAAAAADPFNGYENYYSFDVREKWYFPDGRQWIEFRKLTEGDRARYLKATRSDVHLNQKSGEARIPFDQSKDRLELLLASITDWHIVQWIGDGTSMRPVPVAFQPTSRGGAGGVVGQWISKADPAVLGSLEKAIRKCNPWLLNEMTTEEIDKEIADLQELRAASEAREAEQENFTSK